MKRALYRFPSRVERRDRNYEFDESQVIFMLVSFSNNKSTRGVPVVRIPKSKNYSVVKKLGIRIITGSQEEQKAEPSTS